MSQARTALRSASSGASSSTTPRGPRFSLNPLVNRPGAESSKSSRNERTHHIVLAEIPKSATSQDVLRALKQNNIVKKDFPVSNLTMPPPSCPRGPMQTKNVHLTLEDVDYEQAHHAIKAVVGRPLFPETSSWVQGPRPASNLGMRPNLPAYPSRFTAYKWVDGQLRSLERTGIDSSRSSDRPEGGWKTDATSRPIEIPSVEWCMDTRNKGRRVLLRGLPGMTPEFRIRQAGADYGVEPTQIEEKEDVKRLPSSAGSFTSTWVVTTDSVNNACRLVRKLNKQYWNKNYFGEKFLVRAEIIW